MSQSGGSPVAPVYGRRTYLFALNLSDGHRPPLQTDESWIDI